MTDQRLTEQASKFTAKLLEDCRPDYVYFIATREQGLDDMVKIGYSKNPHRRLEALKLEPGKTGDWLEDMNGTDNLWLFGVISGDSSVEKGLHRYFQKYRVAGEWFWLEPIEEALDEILDDYGL